jgi:glycosyl transferase family 25
MNTTTFFDAVFYINLESRVDRKHQIENELQNLNLKYERFNAIYDSFGIVGCTKSHLEVIKIAKERKLKNVLIFEDDFQLLVTNEEFWNQINKFFKKNIDYDIVMLSYNMMKSEEYDADLLKVFDAQTASGYIVNENMYDKLIKVWEEALPLLASTGKHWIYANDQIWKTLQPQNNWFAFKKRLGKQRASFSNLANAFVDYQV